jgi:pyruvate,water dikinase
MSGSSFAKFAIGLALIASVGCGGGESGTPHSNEPVDMACLIADGAEKPKFLQKIQCKKDFLALSSEPLAASIPGARSVKIVLDSIPDQQIYFQDSQLYKIHYEFASKHLSGNGKPAVPTLATFNMTEYYSTARRFTLASLTYYEGPKIWALELAPYDTATPDRLERLYKAVSEATFLGKDHLYFHPTSTALERLLPASSTIKIKTTKDIFADLTYQPLNVGSTVGQLRFVNKDQVNANNTYLGFRDIVVLEAIPNDISVVAGMISEEFQTPLSHINVLAKNRKTPNMGLRNATKDPKLIALKGKWVRFTVTPSSYTIEEVSTAESDKYWEENKPKPVKLPEPDTSVTDLRDIQKVVVEGTVPLRQAIEAANRAFGAKASGYSVLSNTPEIPARKAFAVPVVYYVQFMEKNGFFARVDQMLADPNFRDKPEVRDATLQKLRDDIKAAPVDMAFQTLLKDKLAKEYPGHTIRFRTSTNAEDLDGFPCAGCYDSHTGDPTIWEANLLMAVKKTWATTWNFRTFEERAYHSIDHKTVAMALLVHYNFPTEEANGVAFTANPFDESGLEPGFYVNVQYGGEFEVVHPPPGVTSDQFIYHFTFPGQPVTYLEHSSVTPMGTTVLDAEQLSSLGKALNAIHERFKPAFGTAGGWYAMDVEFKFDGDPGEKPKLFVKQARPAPGTRK